MTPENEVPEKQRYALLLNGANFACEVLQSLLQLRAPPDLLILPEYAPAPAANATELLETRPQRRLLQLAGSIPLAYAPPSGQAECARLVRRRSIDFLLVACWPYRIAPMLIDSAAKAALNLHPSLLPAYRGPDPIARQLEAGERCFGVTLHLLEQRLDAGDIVAQDGLGEMVKPDRELLEYRAAQIGGRLFIGAINSYDAGWRPRAQTHPGTPENPR